ncbi:MAG: ectoine/hydroxyectoine ABC transporter substrate-binding protein EhuB [FCB group bacterium]|jgi:polar amino acid transport system substrate-binding protein|nr:ectoine/hydroxyectoine ABC transporter substrate-binding protein EhuB [FCB group bacterium]
MRRRYVQTGLALLLAALLAALLASCDGGRAVDPGKSLLEHIQSAGAVRVGYANEAPYAYLDTKTGRLTGEAPEIARAVFKRMGVNEVEGVLTEFGSLIPGLKASRFDIIAAGMYITPARCQQVAFSNPTYRIGEAFVVKAGNPLGLHGYEEVAANPKARLGVVAGTVERGYARGMGVPDAQVIVFPDAPSALAGVEAGRVDAYAGTSLTVQDLLRKAGTPGLEKAEPFRDPVVDGKPLAGYGAFAFRKENAALLEEFNRHLAEFIGSPEHLALVRPFGFTEAQLPNGVTAAELCAQ